MIFKKRKILVTHNGSFHSDDLFSAAAFSILFEKKKQRFKFIRTRDEEIIKKADYVFDVGGIYDIETNRFDHHQKGGAGKRDNGIEYSSFGLVWKKFGEEICESKELAQIIDNKLVAPIDAGDNGFSLVEKKHEIFPYGVQDVLSIFRPSSLENLDKDSQFLKAVVWSKEILSREIKKNSDQIEVVKIIQNFYENSEDKRLVVIDAPKVSRYDIWDALQNFTEPLFAIFGDEEGWGIVTIRKEISGFVAKKDFPQEWAGLTGEEFQKISGVDDAVFCHRGLFLASAKSKEGAIKLAELALEA
ncbi:MAG: MYG1 family protein [Candidatus Paceibacterota bacterium]